MASSTQTVLFTNIHGIQMIRYDSNKTSRVKVVSGKYSLATYRFPKAEPPYFSPYISWANLDCCGGWRYDEEYLKTAVQEGKKLYAGISIYIPKDSSREAMEASIKGVFDTLPEGITGGFEPVCNERYLAYYICREGTLEDYYDIEAVIAYYGKLGIGFSDETAAEIRDLAKVEISCFGSESAPIDYANVFTYASAVITGLLLGYPIESTVSLITGSIT